MHTGNLDLTLDQITKIEGHATVDLKVRDGKIEYLKFSIAEFKRFYTQAVRGKVLAAVPQLVARICGTCSNAHLLCSIQACENALGITPSAQTVKLRRLLNHGLMIRDHALHLYLFSLPDLYKRDSLLAFDENIPEEHELVHDAFAIKEAGNQLAIWTGGRSVHAPMPMIGGFIRLPDASKKQALVAQLKEIRPRVLKGIKIFHECEFTRIEDFSVSALQSETYDYLLGNIVVTNKEPVHAREYARHLQHVVIPYSQASGYKFKGEIYMVGAVARLNLSRQYLHEHTRKDAARALAEFPSKNVYHNNLAQAIEILHSVDDAIDILEKLELVDEKPISKPPKAGVGTSVIEAPRGTLYHKYTVNEKGIVTNADIIVPTGQNQIAIEVSLIHLVEEYLASHDEIDKEELSFEFEKLIRAYDPCMSCASHFLELRIERSES